ncbi:MAG: hypothetical protein C0456_13820 [Hyphomonas sp.]|uniref:hypothetical protein n=1 Tax=Hyphomonas sp. TaxID=87 RepID=UPI001DAEDBFC|nr:hypothetical protein [Hyphomonas sp.]MBA4227701.1 hypothetical protein [Hyphomonas sp.]
MNIQETGGVARVAKLRKVGLDNREIAKRTGLTLGTVQSYCSFLNKANGNAHHASQFMSQASMNSSRVGYGRIRKTRR